MPIQVPQWTMFLNCPVCYRSFGASLKVPITLGCGHTVCKQCLMHLPNKQCSFDQTIVNIENLVINFALLQIVGVPPPSQPQHPLSILALSEKDRRFYDLSIQRIEELSLYLKSHGNGKLGTTQLSRSMQRKLVTLMQCALGEEEGRKKAYRAARSLAERTVTELILQHQNSQQISTNLWSAIRARGCQFIGPTLQEKVLKLVLLALEDGSALSRKVLVMFIMQRLKPDFPQTSKTSIGHVVQLLYRASCFTVSRRERDSSLMQLKKEFRSYDALRREHDSQIIQIAIEAGLKLCPEQGSVLLFGDTTHVSHMQSIINKLQTPQSFMQSVQDLIIVLQRTGDPGRLIDLRPHLELLAAIDSNSHLVSLSWPEIFSALDAVKIVVNGLVYFIWKHGNNNKTQVPQDTEQTSSNNQLTPLDQQLAASTSSSEQSLTTSTTHGNKYKVSMCRDILIRACPRGEACTFAHSEEELKKYRSKSRKVDSQSPNMSDCKTNNSSNEIHPQKMPLHNDSPVSQVPISKSYSMPMPLTYGHGSHNDYNENTSFFSYPFQSNDQFEQINDIGDFSLTNFQEQCLPHQYNNQMFTLPDQTYSNQNNFILDDQRFGFDNNPISLGMDINGYLERNSGIDDEAMLNSRLEGLLPLEQINTNMSTDNLLFDLWQSEHKNPVFNYSSEHNLTPGYHDIFNQSDPILTEDDFVPFEAQTICKPRFIGPTNTINKTTSSVEYSSNQSIGCGQSEASLFSFFHSYITNTDENHVDLMLEIQKEVSLSSKLESKLQDNASSPVKPDKLCQEDTYKGDTAKDFREFELKLEHGLLEIKKLWLNEDETLK